MRTKFSKAKNLRFGRDLFSRMDWWIIFRVNLGGTYFCDLYNFSKISQNCWLFFIPSYFGRQYWKLISKIWTANMFKYSSLNIFFKRIIHCDLFAGLEDSFSWTNSSKIFHNNLFSCVNLAQTFRGFVNKD